MALLHHAKKSERELLRRGRPEASAEIWTWDREKKSSSPRRSGVIRGLVGLVIGVGLFILGAKHVAIFAWVISGVITVLALLSPETAYRKLELVMTKSGELVGTILTWLLLTPVFFTFFLPFRLLFRRGTRDTLERTLDGEAESYWRVRNDKVADVRDLERPF